MTNEDKQEALNDLMYLAGSLSSLSQAFSRTGNKDVAAELWEMKNTIISSVETIREVDRAALHEDAQLCNKFASKMLSALVNREDNNEL